MFGFGDKEFKGILEEKTKIPTAAQIRKYLKDEWHYWTDMERIIVPTILLPADMLLCIEDDTSTRRRLGDNYPKDINKYKESAHKRLIYLDSLLTAISVDIDNYNAYELGLKKATGEEELPPKYEWSIKRHNDHVRLMNFIHQIDEKTKFELYGSLEIKAPKSLFSKGEKKK